VLAVSLEPNAVSGSWIAQDGETRRASICLCKADWSDAWKSGLQDYDQALNELKNRLGVPRGVGVLVAFESETSVSEAQAIPDGDIQNALTSMRLAMCERLSLSRRSESVCAKRLFTASRGNSKNPGIAIVAASSDMDVDSIQAWIERSGLQCAGIVPTGALLLNDVARASKSGLADGLRIVLHVDNYRCSLCVMMDGRAELLRTFEIGLNNLGEAIIRAADSSAKQNQLMNIQACVLEHLQTHGIPQRDMDYIAELGLSSNSVLPLLQPVLQRLCVEVKQSLRMVVRRSGGAIARFDLRGPGASVPRLRDAIAQSIDADVGSEGVLKEDMTVEGCLHRGGWRDLALSSAKVQTAEGYSRFRRAIACGAILGLVALAGETVHYLKTSADLDSQIESMNQQLQQVRDFRTISETAVEMDARLGKGHALLDEFLGSQPYWNAVLTAITKSAQSSVELTEIRGIGDRSDASVLIYGVADASTGSTALADYIEKLNTCSLGNSVEVESRLLIELDKNPVYQFRLRMTLIEFRPELLTMEYAP